MRLLPLSRTCPSDRRYTRRHQLDSCTCPLHTEHRCRRWGPTNRRCMCRCDSPTVRWSWRGSWCMSQKMSQQVLGRTFRWDTQCSLPPMLNRQTASTCPSDMRCTRRHQLDSCTCPLHTEHRCRRWGLTSQRCICSHLTSRCRTVSLRRRGSSSRMQILQATHKQSFASALERMKK